MRELRDDFNTKQNRNKFFSIFFSIFLLDFPLSIFPLTVHPQKNIFLLNNYYPTVAQ